MKAISFLPLFFCLLATSLFSQSNINQTLSVNSSGAAPDASAQLDVQATDKGMLVPRMTTAQRTAITAANALLVFDSDTRSFWFFDTPGAAWREIRAGNVATLQDADGNTKVQVEKNPNEDIIRFGLGGTESMVLQKSAGGSPRLELPNALFNTFIGTSAGQATTTGGFNTANGHGALYSNTTGNGNTANGASALSDNTAGNDNTANGQNALVSNATGNQNTANGHGALYSNTTGDGNTATGRLSLLSNTTGFENTATGKDAMFNTTTGNQNTAIGTNALSINTIGSNNTALGYQADMTANNLTNATAIGYDAKVGCSNCMVLGGTGADAVNVGIGTTSPDASALLDLAATDKGILVPRMTTAQRTAVTAANALLVFDTDTKSFWFFDSVAAAWREIRAGNIAALADADGNTKIQVEESPNEDIIRFDLGSTESMVLQKNAGGSPRLELHNALMNTFVGTNAGQANTTGINNTANGSQALASNTTGEGNTAHGQGALSANTTGFFNTANGWQALISNTTGFINTAVGSGALSSNTTGYSNTANGQAALFWNFSGYWNTAHGHGALYYNTVGNNNTANGVQALYFNTGGNHNAANGVQALFNNTTGNNNTAHGKDALYSNTIGTGNTANGFQALLVNTSGSNNTAFGYAADVSANNLSNATAIGNGTLVNTSDKIHLGNAAVTVIEGQVDWTFPSDARFKFNVDDATVPGLAFIEKLRPVTYQFDTRKFDEHLMQNMADSIRQRRMAGQDYSKSTAQVQTGFLAQEVEQACKNLGYQFSGLHVPESEVDNYGLAYGSFVPLLVKAVQEQQKEIEKLSRQNAGMEIEKLKAENAALKAQLEKITVALQGAGIAVEK